MSGDLYQRLGLKRGASSDEIKKAYRSLAREHHPDKGGDPEVFKGIQEANEVLSDERRRQVYDMTGAVNEQPGGGPPGGMAGMAAGGVPFFMSQMGPFGMPGVNFDMSDLFGMFGGGGGGGPSRRRGGRGPNKQHDIGLKLEQFYKGTNIKLNFNQARRCGTCNASGAEATESCGGCGGSGFRMMQQQMAPGMVIQSRRPCDVCNGEGKRTIRVCKGCQGKKFIEKEKHLDIKVTPGMAEGENLMFPGECSDTLEFDTPGDVLLTLKLATDGSAPVYEWRGADLTYKHTISFAESILGFEVTLADHPSGESPKYSWRGGPLINGAVLKMEGGGMPKRGDGSGGFGVLHIQICVRPPPTVPWSAEDAAKLASVLGAPSVNMAMEKVKDLVLDSSESVFN
jgi:DnaJ family protein A protein 2